MTKSAIIAILGAIIVATAIALNFFFDEAGEKEIAVQDTSPDAKIPNITPKKIEKRLTLNPEPLTKKQAVKPSFDIVRVSPKGDTVIAGRAAPGAQVEIFDGNTQIGEVLADKRGEWVFLPSLPLSPGNRSLSLKMIDETGDKFNSEKALVLMIPEKGKDIAGRPSQVATQPLALKVPVGDKGSVEVLQKTVPIPPAELDLTFAVDAVDYNENGKLNIVGKAPKQGQIQLYLNNKFLGKTKANKTGNWSLVPRNSVETGVYTLRADYIGTDAQVLARREVVFARSVPLTGVQPGTLVVVAPGNSLWRIARRTYGSGFRYTVIYEANKEQIKNADLIFPGQVFALPDKK